jgi:hypothetical protein
LAAEILVSRPSVGAVRIVRDSVTSACSSAARAFCRSARAICRPLAPQHCDLLLRRDRSGLGGGESGLSLLQVGCRLLRPLFGAGAARGKFLGASVFLLREGECSLGLHDLPFRFVDARLLSVDLGIEVGDAGLGLLDLCICLRDLRAIVAIVDAHQDGAFADQPVVGDRNVDDHSVDLHADRHRARIDEGVVGGFELAGVQPPRYRADHDRDEDNEDRGDQQWPVADSREQ